MTGKFSSIIAALRDQQQADEEGIMCVVSRQAVDEAIQALEALQPRPIAEWSKGECNWILGWDDGWSEMAYDDGDWTDTVLWWKIYKPAHFIDPQALPTPEDKE